MRLESFGLECSHVLSESNSVLDIIECSFDTILARRQLQPTKRMSQYRSKRTSKRHYKISASFSALPFFPG
jgi:hypothetical protein